MLGAIASLAISHAHASADINKNQIIDKASANPSLINMAIPTGFYNYVDFKFHSTEGNNYNRYQGHSNQAGIGSDYISIRNKLMAGVTLYEVDTRLNAQYFVAPSVPLNQRQHLKNNSIFLHLLKPIGYLVVDVSGGYGRTKTSNQATLVFTQSPSLTGFGKATNDNWFGGITTYIEQQWKQLSLRGYLQGLYAESDAGNYSINFTGNTAALPISPNTTKATWIIEHAELGYEINPSITPFISGSLVQVPYYKNTNPVVATGIIGALPQLNLNQNGYKVGAGFTLRRKELSFRVEQKYYQTGSIYHSNQTFLRVMYNLT